MARSINDKGYFIWEIPDTGINGMKNLSVAKALGEVPISKPIGQAGKVCKLFYVDDETAEPMGTFQNSQQITMAKKDMGNWTSIYLLSSVMPPSFVRCLEKEAKLGS